MKTMEVKKMGEFAKLVLKNCDGDIVVCLYIEQDGNLHPDSWLCEKGWSPEKAKA